MSTTVDVFDRLKTGNLLPALPPVTARLLELAQSPNASIGEVAAAIQADANLAKRIERIAASPLTDSQREVSSLADAIAVIGVHRAQMLGLSLSVISLGLRPNCPGFDCGKFWPYSLARAVAASVLAQRVQTQIPEEAFVAGLLARIGQLVLAAAMPAEYQQVMQLDPFGSAELAQTEQAALGTTHMETGSRLLESWSFPEPFCRAIEQYPVFSGGDASSLASILYAADLATGIFCEPSNTQPDSVKNALQSVQQCFRIDTREWSELFGKMTAQWREYNKVVSARTGAARSKTPVAPGSPLEKLRMRTPQPEGMAGQDPFAALAARLQAAQSGQSGQAAAAPYGTPTSTAAAISPAAPPTDSSGGKFVPRAPETLQDAGITAEDLERLICKFLLARVACPGRQIAAQLGLTFGVVLPVLTSLKSDLVVGYKNTAPLNDYEYILTDLGRERGRRYTEECSYFGSAPVPLQTYIESVKVQSIAEQHVGEDAVVNAFNDIVIKDQLLRRLGPGINSGRGMFLFGHPGNGKTSIAERITRCFSTGIWIPRTIGVDGEIMRLFDPARHEDLSEIAWGGEEIDRRWVFVRRPTIVVGGELTMDELEVQQNPVSKISEAPLQLKSNGGTLVIDDFGRQRMQTDELLNRWIVPLEKRYDFLNLANGKKIQVPFDQLLIFSTNLEPRDLVDEAFLRRIPYKIHVTDPTLDEYRQIFEMTREQLGFPPNPAALEYLIQTHYQEIERPLRCCHARDLLHQVRNDCLYRNTPLELSNEAFDAAVDSYFTIM